jgi:hypothetical protein
VREYSAEFVGIEGIPLVGLGTLPSRGEGGRTDVVSRVGAALHQYIMSLSEVSSFPEDLDEVQELFERIEFPTLNDWRQRIGEDPIEAHMERLGLDDIPFRSTVQ